MTETAKAKAKRSGARVSETNDTNKRYGIIPLVK